LGHYASLSLSIEQSKTGGRARRGERADDSRQLTAGSEETTVSRKPLRTQSSQREITLLDLLCALGVLCGARYGRILDLNIERQNKEPQNVEVVTSIFEITCSIFCGSEGHLATVSRNHQGQKFHKDFTYSIP
jgi:hypothetical protein